MLAFADANLRATVALRSQAAEAAGADGAAQVAINELRKAPTPAPTNCFGAANALDADELLPAADGCGRLGRGRLRPTTTATSRRHGDADRSGCALLTLPRHAPKIGLKINGMRRRSVGGKCTSTGNVNSTSTDTDLDCPATCEVTGRRLHRQRRSSP